MKNTLLSLFAAGLLSSASAQTNCPWPQTTEQTKLTNAINAWNSKGIQYYDYELTEQYSGANPERYPIRTIVEGTSVKAIDRNAQVVTNGMTVPAMHSQIQGFISDQTTCVYAEYDAVNGWVNMYQSQGTSGQNSIIRRITGFHVNTGTQSQMLANNQAIWSRTGFVNYNYRYSDYTKPPIWNNANWPFDVQIRNGSYNFGSATDSNGNQVLWDGYAAYTIPQFFDMIGRQVSANVPYLEVNYEAGYGYPTQIVFVQHNSNTLWYFDIGNLQPV